MSLLNVALLPAIASAETGGEKDPFIRTRVQPEGGSTAYGPVQITGTLAKEFYNKQSDLFDDEEKQYLERFIKQANLFSKYGAEPEKEGYEQRYDYGGAGDLTSEEDRKLYDRVATKMLNHTFAKNNKDIEKTIKEWRFGVNSSKGREDDPKYFEKVEKAFASYIGLTPEEQAELEELEKVFGEQPSPAKVEQQAKYLPLTPEEQEELAELEKKFGNASVPAPASDVPMASESLERPFTVTEEQR